MARVTTVRLTDSFGNPDFFKIPSAKIKWSDLEGFIVIEGDNGQKLLVHRTLITYMNTEDKD